MTRLEERGLRRKQCSSKQGVIWIGLAIQLWQACITSPESEGDPQLMRNCSVQQRLGANPLGLAGRNRLALPRRGVVSGYAFFLCDSYKANDRIVKDCACLAFQGSG